MSTNYRTFFGMKREAFSSDLSPKEIFETEDIQALQERFDYAVRLGAVALVTGEIGSGKSTALRYVASQAPPIGISTYLCHCLFRLHPRVLPPVPCRTEYRQVEHLTGRHDKAYQERDTRSGTGQETQGGPHRR